MTTSWSMPVVQFLRDCGYRVVEAVTTDESIAILQKTDFPVDVVLKDPSANK
jgi:hypothetical protein